MPKNLFDLGVSTELAGVVTLPAGTTADQTAARLEAFEDRARSDPARNEEDRQRGCRSSSIVRGDGMPGRPLPPTGYVTW